MSSKRSEKKMKVAILGTNFGAYHASIYKKQKGVDSIRIWGRSQEKLDGLRNDLNIETTADINDIMDDPSIDLVNVCMPTSLHKEFVIRALNSGKHVFCETPLCTNAGDVDAVLEAERKSGKRLFVDQFIKFIQEYRFVKEAVDDGRYGKLTALQAWRNTAPFWGKLGNDVIATSLMIHELDFITWLFGSPMGIDAKAKAKNDGETYVEAQITYENTFVSVSASSMMPMGYPFTTGFVAMFEDGAIQASCSFENDYPRKTILEYVNGAVRNIELPLMDPYELAIAHVLECCRTGEASDIGGEAAAMAARAAIEITNLIK
jgi:UDP-N-acetylglucosamine 3-dehydrogenase